MDEPETVRTDFQECTCCHQRVPPTHMVMLSGRRLCLACVNAWFDEEEDD
jgi:recombinational DNA repair protein (RecF pathway)